MNELRRSERFRQPKKLFDQTPIASKPHQSKKVKKNALNPPETRPADVPEASAVGKLLDQPSIEYSPPIRVEYESFKVNWVEKDPFSLFMKFLGEASLIAIVTATNARADGQMGPLPQYPRSWSPLTKEELLCWLGLLFYMALHSERRRKDYWPVLSPFMKRDRWDQIHRFLTFNINTTNSPNAEPLPENPPWWHKVEPIYSTVRENCRLAVTPSSWVVVDEVMVPFSGRTVHTVKLPNKPISEGYKAWALGFEGYYYDWLVHSPVDGAEGCDRKKNRVVESRGPTSTVSLAETFQVPVLLLQRLRMRLPELKLVAFLDNLFLNVNVAHALLKIDVGVMGTTRKNSGGFPKPLLEIKKINRALLYGGHLSIIEGEALCFAWQDNNVVLGMTTAFSLDKGELNDINWTLRTRRRPKESSTNAAIARPIFGDKPFKTLSIPSAIDAYNHHMNGIDVANQIRRNFSCHRLWETRTWRPLAYWLFDVCMVNAFVIWRQL